MQLNTISLKVIFVSFIWLTTYMSNAQELDLTLKQLIVKGLDKSHHMKIHEFEIEQAKIEQSLAKAVLIPKVSFNGSFTRLNDDISFDKDTQSLLMSTQKLLIKEAAGIPFNTPLPDNILVKEIPSLLDRNILKSSVDLEWVLFSGLEVTNAVNASMHREASLNYIGDIEKDNIALKIIEAYDKLALVYASKRVLTTSKNYLNEQEYFVKKSIENGLATPISLKKIELALQQLASKELEFNHNKTLLIEVLHQLTGESRERLTLLNPQLQSFAHSSFYSNEKRYEIKALEEAEKATIYKSKMEKNNFIPKLALKGHYEFMEDDLSLLDPKWFVGVGIKWNVFDGFQSKLKSEKSIIESQKYRQKIEETEEMISLSIIKSHLNYESSLQNIKIAQKEIDLAVATYNIVDKQYKNNLASINDVLDALNDLEKANFKLEESFFNQRRAITDLLHSKGILTTFYN